MKVVIRLNSSACLSFIKDPEITNESLSLNDFPRSHFILMSACNGKKKMVVLRLLLPYVLSIL